MKRRNCGIEASGKEKQKGPVILKYMQKSPKKGHSEQKRRRTTEGRQNSLKN